MIDYYCKKNSRTCLDSEFVVWRFFVGLASSHVEKVHIYDETTKHEIATLQGGSGYGTSSAPGHSNRVFALKFHPDDPEVRHSAGFCYFLTITDDWALQPF